MPQVLVGTLIDAKPTTVVTSRGITITIRIDARRPSGRQLVRESNVTGLGEALILAPLNADLRFGDRFTTGGITYEINGKLAETLFGDIDQYTAVQRE